MSESRPRPAGGRELIEIDLLEVSVTSKPMNAATRALSWKSAADTNVDFTIPSDARQWVRARELGVDELAAKSATKATQIGIATFEC